jgi:hypothetical protein
MYAPVLVEWVSVLLRQRDEVTAQRDNAVDASKEGAWMARALDAERERDVAQAATVNAALIHADLVRERDALKERIARMMESMSMACEEPPAGCECAGCMYSRERVGAALIAVEAGIEAEKVFAAFREEHERVSREFDKWKLGEPERLRAEVGLPRKEKP